VLLRGYSGRAQDVLRCDQGWIEGADVAEFLAGKRGACRFGPAAGRLLLLVLVVAVMTGCAAPTRTGPTLDAVTRTVGTPKPGQARVIVLRDKAFAGIIDAGWQVHLDGVPMGDLKTGTFVYRDRPAGHHQITFARAGDLARVSRHDFDVAGPHLCVSHRAQREGQARCGWQQPGRRPAPARHLGDCARR